MLLRTRLPVIVSVLVVSLRSSPMNSPMLDCSVSTCASISLSASRKAIGQTVRAPGLGQRMRLEERHAAEEGRGAGRTRKAGGRDGIQA